MKLSSHLLYLNRNTSIESQLKSKKNRFYTKYTIKWVWPWSHWESKRFYLSKLASRKEFSSIGALINRKNKRKTMNTVECKEVKNDWEEKRLIERKRGSKRWNETAMSSICDERLATENIPWWKRICYRVQV